MKVKVRCGRVVDMSKTMDPAEADGENLGIVKFGPRRAPPRLVGIMDRLIDAGGVRDWAPRAFASSPGRIRSTPSARAGFPWIEIDFPEDYERAVRERAAADRCGRRTHRGRRGWDGRTERPR